MLRLLRVFSLSLLAGTTAVPVTAETPTDEQLVARGEYLARIMSCSDCHSPRDAKGVPMPERGLIGGTIGFEIPGMGIFWPPNLTADKGALGGWSEDEVVTAIRTGARPDGRQLAPAMPWPSFAALTDQDAKALAKYLLAQPSLANAVPAPAADAAAAKGPYFSVTVPK